MNITTKVSAMLAMTTLMMAFPVAASAANPSIPVRETTGTEAKPSDIAIDLVGGQNTCSFKTGDTSDTFHYYRYTAKERGYLTLNGNTNISIAACDADGNEIPCMAGSEACVIPVKKDMTVYAKICPNFSSVSENFSVTFSDRFTANDNAYRGISADDPIVIRDGESNMTIKTIEGFTGFDSYFTYTAKETGVLSFSSSGYLIMKKYGSSFDNLDHEFVSDYSGGRYIGKIPVVKDQTVCIMVNTYQAITVTCGMEHPDAGTIDNPYEAVIGDNKVPGEFGNYYFMFSGNVEDGFVTLTSEQSLPRGYVEVFSVSDLSTPVAKSVSGTYNVRFMSRKNASYILHVFKAEDSAEEDKDYNPLPDTFNLTFQPLGPGDTANNPIGLTSGQSATTAAYAGTYYYMMTVPADTQAQMLDVQLSGVKSAETRISVYDPQDGPYYSAKGNSHAKKTVVPGHSYMIVVDKADGDPYTITATLRDIIEGEAIQKPILAVKGSNKVQKDNDVYYKYVATMNGRITLTFHIPGISIEFPISEDPTAGSYIASSTGSSYYIDGKEGTTYYIHLKNVSEDTTFELDEHEYAEGESMATAIPVTGNAIIMPGGQASLWYKYTAEKSGKMIMSSEPGFYGDASTILYYCTEENPIPYYMNGSDDEGYIIYNGSKDVVKDEVVYFHVATAGNFGGKRLTISIRDYKTGETISNPYVITPDDPEVRDMPVASRSQFRWVKISMEGVSKVTLTTTRFVSGGIYESTDTSNAYASVFVPNEDNDACTLEYVNDKKLSAIYACIEMSGGIVNLIADYVESDGIEQILADRTDGDMYNVAGQRVSGNHKGITIKNGKKYINK